MRRERSLTCLICVLIVAATWAAAVIQHWSRPALASAAAATALCAIIALLRLPRGQQIPDHPRTARQPDESAEFRRSLFDLCAALKLGVRFCEEHLASRPETLIEQLQQMSDNINSFVNEMTRPVRFYERAHWPWRVSTGGQTRR